jgi:hypothetical protein
MTLLEWLSSLDIEHRTTGDRHCRAGWVQLQCPHCGSNKWHLGFRISDGRANCYACGPKRPIEVLAAASGLSIRDVREAWQALEFSVSEMPLDTETPLRRLVSPEPLRPLRSVHRKYLKGRGFDLDELGSVWGVDKCVGPYSETFGARNNVFIPIYERTQMVSWTSRSVTESRFKYYSAGIDQESKPHKSLLYGIDKVEGRSVIVVEGPTDVWKVGPGAVGTFGLEILDSQVRKLCHFDRVVICLDNSTTAQSAADNLADRLEMYSDVIVVCLDADDPGSASRREIRKLRKLAGV